MVLSFKVTDTSKDKHQGLQANSIPECIMKSFISWNWFLVIMCYIICNEESNETDTALQSYQTDICQYTVNIACRQTFHCTASWNIRIYQNLFVANWEEITGGQNIIISISLCR